MPVVLHARAIARRLTFSVVALALAVPAFGQEQIPERAEEYRVKAAILYNLAKFVDWPSDAFVDADAPLVMCVLGADPFGSMLDDALRGHLVGGRRLTAVRLEDLKAGCHVLFISGSEDRRLALITEKVRDASVLTISESDAFTSLGGIIGLATAGERVHFDINARAAERAGLKVSARLLALSVSTHRAGAPTK